MKIWKTVFLILFIFSFPAKYTHAQVYKGVVLNELTRKAVPFVTVSLQNEDNEHIRHTSTEEDGTFLLVAPDVVNYYLHVKRIGYSENTGGPFLVETGDTLSVQFRIMETTESLGEITVEGTPYEEILIENHLKSKGFIKRKNQGTRQFFTKKDIKERNANYTSDLFRTTHGIRKTYDPRTGQSAIKNQRTDCSPKIILNGLSMGYSAPLVLQDFYGSSLSMVDHISIDNIVGVEVYSGIIGQPTEFGPKTQCGVVVFWTR